MISKDSITYPGQVPGRNGEKTIWKKRVFLIVLDSFGIGAEPDAAAFGDEGTNTLGAIAKHPNFNCPNLQKMGMFNIDGVTAGEKTAAPIGSFARLQEQSMGKDTTIGHWEIAGVVSPKPLPTFPNGFPDELIHEFEEKTGHKVLCNKPYSGTQVLKDYGEQAMKENALIVYTSADSVFQVAANEELVPVHELYRYCEIAREMLKGRVRRGPRDRTPLPGPHCGYLLPHHQPPRPEPQAAPRYHAGSAERCWQGCDRCG